MAGLAPCYKDSQFVWSLSNILVVLRRNINLNTKESSSPPCPCKNAVQDEKLSPSTKFLEYLSKIAPVTLETEIQCPAYAWFRSAEDNEAVPHHWLRGFEVYETPEANTVAHRASAPYKRFRAAVGEESLLERPSDLRFWRPTGVGFLGRPGATNLMKKGTGPGSQYAVMHELTPGAGMKNQALTELRKVADLAEKTPSAATFWVLHRGEGEEDESLYVFGLFTTRKEAERFEIGESAGAWKHLEEICESTRRTTWVECGIGFIGRAS